jgi:phage terminase large subunit-like protein
MLTRFRRRQRRKAFHYSQTQSQSIVLPQYTPVNDKARQFHESTAKINILPGGNRGGKTTTASFDHIFYARQQPCGCKGLALTNTYEKIGENLWPHYKEWLHPSEWVWIKGNQREDNPKIIQFKKNGYKIYFGSYEQGRRSHQSSDWDYVHFDEEAPFDIWVEVFRGTLDHNGRIGYSYTPIENYEYIEELEEKGKDPSEPNYWAPQEPMSLYENNHISQEAKDVWISMLPENIRKYRIYGYRGQREGLVYPEFTPEIHVCEPFSIPYDWTFYRVLDFGKVHPTVSLIMATDGYYMYVVDEYYQPARLIDYHVKQFRAQHQRLITTHENVNWKPQLIGVSDHDAQLRLEYETRGIYTKPAQKKVMGGIEVVQMLLAIPEGEHHPRLRVFATCKNTIRQMGKYVYPGVDKHGDLKPGEKAENPEKKHDDCPDCVRYGCVEHFGYIQWNPINIASG